jgi:hypothetical protein
MLLLTHPVKGIGTDSTQRLPDIVLLLCCSGTLPEARGLTQSAMLLLLRHPLKAGGNTPLPSKNCLPECIVCLKIAL